MIKNLHDIDKIFKEGLEDHCEPVPSSVWESLNNDLDKKQAAHYREKYFRLKKLAVFLLLLVAFSGIYLVYFNPSIKKDNSIAAKKTNQLINAKDQTASANKNTRTANNHPTQPAGTASPQTVDGPGIKKETVQPTANGTIITDPNHANSDAPKITVEKTTSSYQKLANTVVTEKNITSSVNHPSIELNNAPKKLRVKKGSLKYIAGETNETVNGQHKYIIQQQPLTKNNSAGAAIENISSINAFESRTAAAESRLLEPFVPAVLSADVPAPGQPTSAHGIPLSDSVTKNVQGQIAKLRAKNNAMSVHRFSLTAFGAPNHSFTRLENDWRFSGPGRDKNEALNSEQQGRSFSAGLLLNYGLSRHWVIQSGMVFSSTTTNIAPKTIYARQDNYGQPRYELNCSSGYAFFTAKAGSQPAVGDSIKIIGSSFTISYIGVPVAVNYVLKTGKFLIKPGVGFSLNFLTGNHSATDFIPDNRKESTAISGLKSSYLDVSLGLGIEYMFSRRIAVGIRPLARWALTSINKDTPVKAYQNFTSLEAGLRINL